MCFPCSQVGFGVYPVVVRKFGTEEKANPYVFTFYRYVQSLYNNTCCSIKLMMGWGAGEGACSYTYTGNYYSCGDSMLVRDTP